MFSYRILPPIGDQELSFENLVFWLLHVPSGCSREILNVVIDLGLVSCRKSRHNVIIEGGGGIMVEFLILKEGKTIRQVS